MKKKGSITVFSVLCLMLVASFLFALLESARVHGLNTYVNMKTQLGLESVCAAYQPQLWEEYHLLYLDGAYGKAEFSMENVTEDLKQQINENLDTGLGHVYGMDLFQISLTQAEPNHYQLATDGQGSVFLRHVSEYMKDHLPQEMAAIIHERYMQGEEVEDTNGAKNSVEDADLAIREAKAEQEKGETETAAPEVLAETEEVVNPLDIVLELKRNTILGMVVQDIAAVSTKKTDLSEGLQKREFRQENAVDAGESKWYERILVLEYADQYFSDFTQPEEEHAFTYELEYLLCGKEEDKANLEGAVNRLLLLREAANVTHILADRQKLNEALILANVLAGFTGNPAVIKVVQIGIVAAWAYMESIQDIRALLQGDKIALIKNKEQWTVNTDNLLDSFQSSAKAKNCTNGLTYQDYLKQLLFLMKTKDLAYRMMDVMEQNIRLTEGFGNFRMDYMISDMTYSMQYEAKPQFLSLSVIGNRGIRQLIFRQTDRFSYYQ